MNDFPDREETVFSEALKLPPAERPAYLATACGGDDGLRQRVEELIRVTERATGFLETPAMVEVTQETAALAPGAGEKPGDRIGHYTLLEQIGVGGCGIVYRAEQHEPVRRQVALKVIKLGMDTRQVIARFEAERQALAMMNHPNIAKVLDAGATESGRPYFVMELVEGVRITDYCDQNHLSTKERLELFSRICHAIQHAHQKGIIHRDIKPSNILVATVDGEPLPKVIDFGIAKATHGKLTEQTVFTALEQFMGTPAYMSPEQAGMDGLDIDTRSDIYSLGVLLYALLTGQTPFDAEKLHDSGVDEIRRTIREQEPALPSTMVSTMHGANLGSIAKQRQTEPSKLVHSLRGDLDWIIMKALEKDRARRYETASDFAADIQRHLNDEPVLAGPPGNLYRFQKWARRNKLIFATASAIVLALAVGMGVAVWGLARERQERIVADNLRQKAEADERKAEAEAGKSKQVAKFLEDMLAGVGPSVAAGNDTTMLRDILDKTSQRLGTDLARQPEVEAEMLGKLGTVYWDLGEMEKAEKMQRSALALRRTLSTNGQGPEMAQTMVSLGHILWRRGSMDEAEKMLRDALAMEQNIYGRTNLDVADTLENLAAIVNTRKGAPDATPLLIQSLEIREAICGHEDLEVARVMEEIARVDLNWHTRVAESENLLREALDIRRRLQGETNTFYVIAALKLQIAEADVNDQPRKEEDALRQLLSVERKVYGMHPNVAQTLNNLSSVLKSEYKLEESESLRREALGMQRKRLGDESAEVAQTEWNLGQVLGDEGKLAEAEEAYRQSLDIRGKIFGRHQRLTMMAFEDLGLTLEKEGKINEARGLYRGMATGNSGAANGAEYYLGASYLGRSNAPPDYVEAAKHLRKSANGGNSRAQIALGVLNFKGQGMPKDEKRALFWLQKPEGKDALNAMKALKGCYLEEGRGDEAITVLQSYCDANSPDRESMLTLATLQAWYGKDADFTVTCRKFLEQAQAATGTSEALIDESAAKAYCLRPSTDPSLLAEAVKVAQRGVELKRESISLSWYQLSLGMAQYRGGQYAEAEKTLAMTERGAGSRPDLIRAARMFRVMTIFQQNRTDEARKLFDDSASLLFRYPDDETKPVIDGKAAFHDVVIAWLARKEAKTVLNGLLARP